MTGNLHKEFCAHLAKYVKERNMFYTPSRESMKHFMPDTLSADF
jgi:hypothetical protein